MSVIDEISNILHMALFKLKKICTGGFLHFSMTQDSHTENVFFFCIFNSLETRFIKTVASIWRENMLGYLSADIICSTKLTVFFKLRFRKTVRFSEQIMFKDKCPKILSPQLKAIVFIIPQTSLAMRAVLKIEGCSRMFFNFSWETSVT